MSKPRKQHGVVVGVDGSLESDAAACWGATDAAMRNIPLTVVHVVNADVATWPPMPYPETWGVWQEDEGRQIVANAVKGSAGPRLARFGQLEPGATRRVPGRGHPQR